MINVFRKLGSYYLYKKSPYYFVSFPKSGRTWVKSFLANYYSSYLGIPLFYNFSPILKIGKRQRVPRIMFMHPPHRIESKDEQLEFIKKLQGKKVIFLVRDPESVVFTYYHRLMKRMRDTEVSCMDIKQFIRDPSYGISQIVDFMNLWYESRGSFRGFVLLRYEDCVSDSRCEFKRLLTYLDSPLKEKEFNLAISRCVDTTRKIEQDEFVFDGSLQHDISKGSQYFESRSQRENIIDDECIRYAGDDASLKDVITEADRDFMTAEVSRLNPALGY